MDPARIATDMAGFAQGLVDLVKRADASAPPLDFTENTIGVLDVWVARIGQLMKDKPNEADAIYRANAIQCGAYMGEVVRRNCGGYWVPRGPAEGLAGVECSGVCVIPIPAMGEFLAGRQIQMPDRAVTKPSEYLQDIVSALRAAYQQRLCGEAGTTDALGKAMTDDASIAQPLISSLISALNTAEDRWHVSLDFTPESIATLEQILDVMHTGCKSESTRPTDDQLKTLCTIWGVYLGETLRRRHSGKWSLKDRALCLEVQGVMPMTVYPMLKIRKRIVDGPGDNVAYYFNVMEKMLRGELDPGKTQAK